MKRLLITLLYLFTAASLAFAQDFTKEENEQLQLALEYSDNGNANKAIDIYNKLLKKYPGNSSLLYEKAYCYYVKQDFKTAAKLCKKAESDEDPGGFVYGLHGNSLDNMGKRKEAIKKYKEGLAKYPDFGQLYLELGTVYVMENRLDEAVDSYTQGIKADPTFTSNYFRISQLLCKTNEPVWGIIYGEIHQLLSPNSSRSEELSKEMYEAYNANIRLENDSTLLVSLTAKNELAFDGKSLHIPFEILFEEYSTQEEDIDILKEKGHLDLQSLVEKRRVFLTRMFGNNQNQQYLYPIFKYQQKVLEAGHWEAYNMWLLREGNFDEFGAWLKENMDKFEAFVNWYNENNFDPTSK